MSTGKAKLRPPAPRLESDRRVEIPRTVGAQDTTAGDAIPRGKTRADWREDEFTRVIRQHGKYVIWRKALLCPCFNPETEQAVVDCDDCNGDGYIYVDPLCIQAVMLMFDKRTSIYERFGLWQEGNVQITVEAKYRFGYRDSFELRDSVVPFNELLIKGNRRARRATLPDGTDSGRFRMANITKVIHKKDSGELISLTEGIHFTRTPEGWLRWLSAGDRAVPDGGVISVHYDHRPIYIVLSHTHVTRDDTSGRKAVTTQPRVIAHPISGMAKLDFLVNVNRIPALDDPNVPEPTGTS